MYLPPKIVYERMWKHVRARHVTHDNIIRRIRFACWITKATHTICNTYCFSTSTVVSRTHLNVGLCTHCVSCCNSRSCIATNAEGRRPRVGVGVRIWTKLVVVVYLTAGRGVRGQSIPRKFAGTAVAAV